MRFFSSVALRRFLFFVGGAILTFAIQQLLEDSGVHFDDLAALSYRWIVSHVSLIASAVGGLALLIGSAFLPPGFTHLNPATPVAAPRKRRATTKPRVKTRNDSK